MNTRENDRLKTLLRTALPPTPDEAPPRDLWPDVGHRIAAQPASLARAVPWFDWALAGGVALVAVAFPAAVPLFLYYL